MINLESKTHFDSEVFPGVSFEIRAYSEGVRQELRRKIGKNGRVLAEAIAEKNRLEAEHLRAIENAPGLAEATKERDDLFKDFKDGEEATPEMIAANRRVAELTPLPSSEYLDAAQLVDDIISCEIRPAYLRVAFVRAEGIQANGKPLTADDILYLRQDPGKPSFYREVIAAIEGEYGLSESHKGESALPTISGAPEVGSEESTSAANANGKGITNSETAPAISPVK